MSVRAKLPKPFFILAPMDDVTDTVFRQIIAGLAPPDLFFTEFTNVDGLMSPGRARLLKKLQHTERDQPLVAHLWGKNPDNFYRIARQIAGGELGNFVGIDLNMGCPVKHVVKSGVCSALMNDRPLAKEIIQATKNGAEAKIPVSVKTRLGFNEIDFSWHEFLLHEKLNMLTIHARTRKQMSKVPAQWEPLGKIRELRDRLAPETLIVGNGDVANRQHGLELAKKYRLDGIMIGRGVFHDPFAFSPKSPWASFTPEQKINLFRRHIVLFQKIWQDSARPIHTLNKFCKVYINGFDGAGELRAQLMSAASADDLLARLETAHPKAPLKATV